MLAPSTPPAAPYLTSADFTTGQDAWNKLVQLGTSDALNQAFTMSSGGASVRIGGLHFPIECIKQLLSAVAVRYIQVRFVLLPPALQQFTAVLYAADENGVPLTAYYGPGTPTPIPTPITDSPIPSVLALDWITAWQNTSPLINPMFTSDNQPLAGYNFEVEGFVQALFAAGNNTSQLLLLGAHDYYGAGYNGTPTSKFGVIVSTPAPTTSTAAVNAMYLDMAMPSPPY